MINSVLNSQIVIFVDKLVNVVGVKALNNVYLVILVVLIVLMIVLMAGCSILLNVKIMSKLVNCPIGPKMLLDSKMLKLLTMKANTLESIIMNLTISSKSNRFRLEPKRKKKLIIKSISSLINRTLKKSSRELNHSMESRLSGSHLSIKN